MYYIEITCYTDISVKRRSESCTISCFQALLWILLFFDWQKKSTQTEEREKNRTKLKNGSWCLKFPECMSWRWRENWFSKFCVCFFSFVPFSLPLHHIFSLIEMVMEHETVQKHLLRMIILIPYNTKSWTINSLSNMLIIFVGCLFFSTSVRWRISFFCIIHGLDFRVFILSFEHWFFKTVSAVSFFRVQLIIVRLCMCLCFALVIHYTNTRNYQVKTLCLLLFSIALMT